MADLLLAKSLPVVTNTRLGKKPTDWLVLENMWKTELMDSSTESDTVVNTVFLKGIG